MIAQFFNYLETLTWIPTIKDYIVVIGMLVVLVGLLFSKKR